MRGFGPFLWLTGRRGHNNHIDDDNSGAHVDLVDLGQVWWRRHGRHGWSVQGVVGLGSIVHSPQVASSSWGALA